MQQSGFAEDVRAEVTRRILNTEEEGVKAVLIGMGWTPPSSIRIRPASDGVSREQVCQLAEMFYLRGIIPERLLVDKHSTAAIYSHLSNSLRGRSFGRG